MSSIADLYALQELDLRVNGDRDELADIQPQLGETDELLEAKTAVAERRRELEAAERLFREREAEADGLRAKIEPVEQKLYKGSIQSPKELEDLQQDLDSLKRRRSDLEDLALEAMSALETAQEALSEAERAEQEAEQTHGVEQSELLGRKMTLEREIAELQKRRAAAASAIDDPMLQLYDRLAASHQGRAVAKVEGGACGGCRIALPTNLLQRARSGSEMVRCSSCDRILYVSL